MVIHRIVEASYGEVLYCEVPGSPTASAAGAKSAKARMAARAATGTWMPAEYRRLVREQNMMAASVSGRARRIVTCPSREPPLALGLLAAIKRCEDGRGTLQDRRAHLLRGASGTMVSLRLSSVGEEA